MLDKKYLSILPIVVLISFLFLFPLGRVFQLGFYSSPIDGARFIGLSNYMSLFSDKIFLETTVRTFLYMAVVVSASFWIGFGFALLTYKKFRGVGIIRTIFILPMLLIPAAASVIWIVMYNYDIGIINHFLELLGFGRIGFLASGNTALLSVMITDIWAWSPFCFIILLAGLQSLPQEPFDAAMMDGASGFQRFRHLILPMMKPIIIITLLLKSVDTFRVFDYVWCMTYGGGPGWSSHVLSTYCYKIGFWTFKFEYASAAGTIFFGFCFILSLIFIIYIRKVSK